MNQPDALVALRPVAQALEKLGVRYYLGGSIVSSVYGTPRTTLDIDLVADLQQQHVEPLVVALRQDYYVDRAMISDAITRKSCFNVIHLHTMFKVDVFAVRDRRYDRVAAGRIRRDRLEIGSHRDTFPMAAPEDIVLNKLEWFRLGDEVSERQWHDVVGVLRVQKEQLDNDYLDRWGGELGVADLLARARRESEP